MAWFILATAAVGGTFLYIGMTLLLQYVIYRIHNSREDKS